MNDDQRVPHVLVVEDEPDLMALYKIMLQKKGYQLDTAEDGETALAKIQAGGYDLVLLDVMLPKKDGMQILETLQTEKPKVPNKKIVLLTNIVQDNIAQKGQQLGADGYLIKSDYNPEEFVQAIQKFLV